MYKSERKRQFLRTTHVRFLQLHFAIKNYTFEIIIILIIKKFKMGLIRMEIVFAIIFYHFHSKINLPFVEIWQNLMMVSRVLSLVTCDGISSIIALPVISLNFIEIMTILRLKTLEEIDFLSEWSSLRRDTCTFCKCTLSTVGQMSFCCALKYQVLMDDFNSLVIFLGWIAP